MNISKYLSNHSISTYNSCPHKFKLKHMNKVTRNIKVNNKYISFDRSLHEIMSTINVLSIDKLKDKALLLNILEENWISEGYASINEENHFKYRGYNILLNYCNSPRDIGNENLIINKILSTKLSNGTIISSRVDKVYEHTNSILEVVDYKSGYTINRQLDFYSNYQLPLYLLLVHKKLGVYPLAISYYYLSYNKKFTYIVSNHDIKCAENLLINTISKIHNELDFSCSPGPYCQDYCDCYKFCKPHST